MKRLACGGCSGGILNLFLDLGDSPIANRYSSSPTEKQERYPLQLVRCAQCGLVQISEIVDDYELYGVDYGFYSGGSWPQREYHRMGAELLLKRHRAQAERGVVEVACNDGSLLRHFHESGLPVLGVDPAGGPVGVARAAGLPVVQAPLTKALAEEILQDRGPAGLVIAYNSMAHVEDLGEVLTAIRTLMDDESVAVFEVQYLPDMIAGNMYDQVYHEHRFYYSLTSLRHAAALHGLYVIDAELIELQHGGLRVTLSTDKWCWVDKDVYRIENTEKWLRGIPSIQGQIDRTKEHLIQLVSRELEHGNRMGGYAAAAKATTILNFCEMGPETIPFVIDETPYKQGKFIPGTAIPIIAQEDAEPVDTMLLLSSNYLRTVLRANPHKGSWIVPQPIPMVI